MIQSMMTITASLTAWKKVRIASFLSRWTRLIAAPKMMLKTMSCSSSNSDAAANGLRGTMLSSVSTTDGRCSASVSRPAASPSYCAMSASRVAGSMRAPGRTTFETSRPIVTATAVVPR
jgi:hypothetical protein